MLVLRRHLDLKVKILKITFSENQAIKRFSYLNYRDRRFSGLLFLLRKKYNPAYALL